MFSPVGVFGFHGAFCSLKLTIPYEEYVRKIYLL